MSKQIKIPIKKLSSDINIPKYAHTNDAAFDLSSRINTNLNPFERKVIWCGISINIPNGFAGLIMPRSGLAIKHGISILNSPGLIDSGYIGEIGAILINLDPKNSFKINIGDRIAQMMIIDYRMCTLNVVKKFEETDRNMNGLGSTGIK